MFSFLAKHRHQKQILNYFTEQLKAFLINWWQGNKCFLRSQELTIDILLPLKGCRKLDSSNSNRKINQFLRMYSPYWLFSPVLEPHFIANLLPMQISSQHLLQHSLLCQHQKASTEEALQKPVNHTLLLKALNTLK